MSNQEELLRLMAAERAEVRPSAAAERGLGDLRDALHAGVPALPVAHGPLQLGGFSLAAKGAALSSVALVGFAATGLVSRAPSPPAPPSVVAASTSPARSPTAVALTAPATASSAAPIMSASSPPKPAVALSSSAEPAPPSSFADELRLMKSAKQDLDGGKELLAQVWLKEHARLYPNGVFQSEREALSVLIGCRQSLAGGREAARRYVALHGSSPLLDRISRACQLERTEEPRSTVPEPVPAAVPTANFPDEPSGK